MTVSPVNLNQALATFTDIYSPRIVGRVNDYDIRIAHTRGEHVWHVHDHTDEFFLVLDGRFDIALRDAGGTARAAVAVAVPTTRLSGATRKEIASALVDQAKQLVV